MKRLTLFLILSFGVPCAWAQEAADTAAYAAAVGEEPAAEAASPEQLWDRANTAYVNGDYHAAAEIYEGILAQGLSSVKLYYNLANAYFKVGSWANPSSFTAGPCGWLPATTTSAII